MHQFINEYLEKLRPFYDGKEVLILGGLGFIGSNLAKLLNKLGAHISILDNLDPLYGGDRENIPSGFHIKPTIIIGDIRDTELLENIIPGKDIIFNFAAQVSPIDSTKLPEKDLEINGLGTLRILETIRKVNPKAKFVFSSSRLVIGKEIQNPITEDHPLRPTSPYGKHKQLSEYYCDFYHKEYGVRTTVVRITNPYGPNQQVKHSKYSIPGWFMRQALEGYPITIFGEGDQLRDYIYIDDLINAIAGVGVLEETDGQLYNCGSGVSIPLKEMVSIIKEIVPSTQILHTPWPNNYQNQETGNCSISIEKIQKHTGWNPCCDIRYGLNGLHQYLIQNSQRLGIKTLH